MTLKQGGAIALDHPFNSLKPRQVGTDSRETDWLDLVGKPSPKTQALAMHDDCTYQPSVEFPLAWEAN